MVTKKFCFLLCGVLVLVLLTSCGKPQEQDPVSVVQTFYEAANAEDIDAFMALVADDAEIEWGREGLVIGKENIRRHAEALFLDFDFTFYGWQGTSRSEYQENLAIVRRLRVRQHVRYYA